MCENILNLLQFSSFICSAVALLCFVLLESVLDALIQN
jgi:hypothetical protein